MPKLNKLDKMLKNTDKIADHAQAIVAVAGLVSAAASVIIKIKENEKEKIDISAICGKTGHAMNVDEAKEYLQQIEVKASYVPIKTSEADPKYRDCFEFQVVDVTPSTKISPNETPIVHYVTCKIIEKSQQLFDEAERQRMIDKEEKQLKRFERKEKIKNGVDKLFPIHRKQHDDEK